MHHEPMVPVDVCVLPQLLSVCATGCGDPRVGARGATTAPSACSHVRACMDAYR